MFAWSCLDYTPVQFDFLHYDPEVEPPKPEYELNEYKQYMLDNSGAPCRDILDFVIEFQPSVSQPTLVIPEDTFPPDRIIEFTLSLTSKLRPTVIASHAKVVLLTRWGKGFVVEVEYALPVGFDKDGYNFGDDLMMTSTTTIIDEKSKHKVPSYKWTLPAGFPLANIVGGDEANLLASSIRVRSGTMVFPNTYDFTLVTTLRIGEKDIRVINAETIRPNEPPEKAQN